MIGAGAGASILQRAAVEDQVTRDIAGPRDCSPQG